MDRPDKHSWQTTVAILASVVLGGAFGCGADDTMRPATVFVVHVDSVIAPSQIDEGDTLAIKVHGRIGPSLCYEFKEFVFEKTGTQLDLTVLGVVPDLRHRACAAAIAQLRDDDGRLGKPFLVKPPMVDPFRIVVHQPDGTTLEEVIRVIPSP